MIVDNREQVQEKLKAAGIPTAVHYPVPLHLQPAYKELSRISGSVLNAEARARVVMSLPMSPDLDVGVQENVVQALGEAIR